MLGGRGVSEASEFANAARDVAVEGRFVREDRADAGSVYVSRGAVAKDEHNKLADRPEKN